MSGYKESTLQAFIESCEPAKPDRERVAAALASPLHGRAGRADRTGKGTTTRTNPPAAPVTEPDSPARIIAPPKPSPDHVTAKEEPAPPCPLCSCEGGLTRRSDGLLACGDPDRIGCDWAEARA